jgi:hypothetical protein
MHRWHCDFEVRARVILPHSNTVLRVLSGKEIHKSLPPMIPVVDKSSQCAVRWYPPSYDIRVETLPIPGYADPSLVLLLHHTHSNTCVFVSRIEHPDDAIVKIQVRRCSSELA